MNFNLGGIIVELFDHIDPSMYQKYTNIDEKGSNIMYDEYLKYVQ